MNNWVSYIKQAVNTVEATLDNMLEEENEKERLKPSGTKRKAKDNVQSEVSNYAQEQSKAQGDKGIEKELKYSEDGLMPNTPSIKSPGESEDQLDSKPRITDLISVGETSISTTQNAITLIDISGNLPVESVEKTEINSASCGKYGDNDAQSIDPEFRKDMKSKTIELSGNNITYGTTVPIQIDILENKEVSLVNLQKDQDTITSPLMATEEPMKLKQELIKSAERIKMMELSHRAELKKIQDKLKSDTKTSMGVNDSEQIKQLTTALAEKESRINELLQEGEQLARDILRLNNTIKKMKQEKEVSSKEILRKEKAFQEKEAKADKIQNQNQTLLEAEKILKDTVRKISDKEQASQKKIQELESALIRYRQETNDLRGVNESLKSQMIEYKDQVDKESMKNQSEALEEQLTRNSDLEAQLSSAKQIILDMQLTLQRTIESSQKEIATLQQQMNTKEGTKNPEKDTQQKQIQNLEQRLFTVEKKNEDLKYSSENAVAPLLLKITNLETKYHLALTDWKSVESNMAHRCQMAEKENQILEDEKLKLSNALNDTNIQLAELKSKNLNLTAELKSAQAKHDKLKELKVSEMNELSATHNHIISIMKKEYEEKLKHAQQKSTLSSFSSQTDFDPPPIQSTVEESPRNPTGITITNLTSQIKVLKNQIQTMESQMEALDNSRNQTNKELIQLQQNYENLFQDSLEYEKLKISHRDLNERYNTVLELLGEKEEKVAELEHDIRDIKEAYREELQKKFG